MKIEAYCNLITITVTVEEVNILASEAMVDDEVLVCDIIVLLRSAVDQTNRIQNLNQTDV